MRNNSPKVENMQVLFTKSDLIGSKLIREVTGEPVSHCALLIGDVVVHSSFSGLTVEFYSNFIQRNQVVLTLQLADTWVFEIPTESRYDYGAFFYLGIKLLLGRIGIKLPKKNLWQTSGMYLCTEFITDQLYKQEHSLVTPYQLYQKLKTDPNYIITGANDERLDT